MGTNDAEHDYVAGQFRASFAALFATFEKANVAALASHAWQIDLSYGAHPRQTFDLCAARGHAAATVLYLHAGYWQARDKSQFRFLAPALSDAGFNVGLINYPLCPDVSLSELSSAVRSALPVLISTLPLEQRAAPIIVSGHSAGAHLALEIALAQDPATTPAERRIRGLVPISGIYDLEPLIQTSLNVKLRLDSGQARENSPLHRLRPALPSAVFLVGAEETEAFHQQSRAMSRAWSEAGNASEYAALPGLDHFSLLQRLQEVDGPLVRIIDRLARAPQAVLCRGVLR
jgi:arylformamidase